MLGSAVESLPAFKNRLAQQLAFKLDALIHPLFEKDPNKTLYFLCRLAEVRRKLSKDVGFRQYDDLDAIVVYYWSEVEARHKKGLEEQRKYVRDLYRGVVGDILKLGGCPEDWGERVSEDWREVLDRAVDIVINIINAVVLEKERDPRLARALLKSIRKDIDQLEQLIKETAEKSAGD